MVNHDHNDDKMGGPPPLDESWWMAILDNVEKRYAPKSKPATEPEVPVQEPEPELEPEPEPAPAPESKAETPEQDWERAKILYENDQVIDLKVTGYNRGGILVEIDDLKGFVPVSHLIQISRKCEDEDSLQNALEAYVGKTLPLKVIECAPERGRVVFSERAAQADTGRRIELLEDMDEGDCLHGQVTTITDFGAFVDLGGIEGLVHISELSWGRVHHPGDIVSTGQPVDVTVIQIDRERSRVALSLKRLLPNPWDTIQEHYHNGQIADATITSVVSFGAFARLDSGVDGLIHASELGTNGHQSPLQKEVISEGQRVQVRILHIDAERQRLGLSLQQIYD